MNEQNLIDNLLNNIESIYELSGIECNATREEKPKLVPSSDYMEFEFTFEELCSIKKKSIYKSAEYFEKYLHRLLTFDNVKFPESLLNLCLENLSDDCNFNDVCNVFKIHVPKKYYTFKNFVYYKKTNRKIILTRNEINYLKNKHLKINYEFFLKYPDRKKTLNLNTFFINICIIKFNKDFREFFRLPIDKKIIEKNNNLFRELIGFI